MVTEKDAASGESRQNATEGAEYTKGSKVESAQESVASCQSMDACRAVEVVGG